MGSKPLQYILENIKEGCRYNCTITLPRTHEFHSFKMKDVLTQQVVESIRTGDYYKLPINSGYYLELNNGRPINHYSLQPPSLTIQDLKDALPGIVFSVDKYNFGFKNFKPLCSIEDIKTLSGYLCIDIDKLNQEDLIKYKTDLFHKFSFVKAVFVSPSGKGLKIVIKYNDCSGFLSDPNIRKDVHMWKDVYHELNMQLFSEIHQQTGLNCDPNAIDMNRLCYMSFDPEILIRIDNDVNPFNFKNINSGTKTISTVSEYKKAIKKERENYKFHEIKEGDASKFVNDLLFFINFMDKNNKRPFRDSDYDSVIYFIFGMVDAAHVYGLEKSLTYDLVNKVISLDPYYRDHKGEGESFIRNRFENAWSNYNPNRVDRRTLFTVNAMMNRILQV